MILRINRIRLEFKVYTALIQNKATIGLIESDWNLKHYRLTHLLENGHGLIESDWNLKRYEIDWASVPVDGLIESDWNLKELRKPAA